METIKYERAVIEVIEAEPIICVSTAADPRFIKGNDATASVGSKEYSNALFE